MKFNTENMSKTNIEKFDFYLFLFLHLSRIQPDSDPAPISKQSPWKASLLPLSLPFVAPDASAERTGLGFEWQKLLMFVKNGESLDVTNTINVVIQLTTYSNLKWFYLNVSLARSKQMSRGSEEVRHQPVPSFGSSVPQTRHSFGSE